MNNLGKIKVNNWILFLSTVTVVFQIAAIIYIVPKMAMMAHETDQTARTEIFNSLMVNVPFIILFLGGGICTLALPLYFFFTNQTLIQKRWLMIITVLAIYVLNFYFILALLCLSVYLWRFAMEFQEFRRT